MPNNTYGAFAPDGREYRITNPATPRPWSNIIANPRMGLAVSQTGSGFTWIDNSQLAVITRWQQDLAEDRSGKYLYIRDTETGETWSLSPAPCWPDYDSYTCRHGLGYTVFETECQGIRAAWTLFVDPVETAELWLLELSDLSGKQRNLELISYLEWNCGVAPSPRREFHKLFIDTDFDAARGAIWARNHMWEAVAERYGHWNTDFPYWSAFGTNGRVASATGDKTRFLGRYGTLISPAAFNHDSWEPAFGRHEDAIGAMRSPVQISPNGSYTTTFTLAVGRERDHVEQLIDRFRAEHEVRASLDRAIASWRTRLAAHHVETPDPSWDRLTNDWLRYQAISGRIWGRAGYYQQSGAYGFRDQLQDSQVWLTINPAHCREQLRLHAAHQFADGSVYHWWHPLSEQGLVTKMTDDLLWLGFVTAAYIRETGDWSVLDDKAPFLDDPTECPLREHVARAFNRVFQRTSPRGLPYIGAGDWNDGLSAAGLEEKGESIWLGHFLAGLLADWTDIYNHIGNEKAAADFTNRRAKLVEALNTHGWDGDWYMRATLDNGEKLGSAECEEGRIFLNAQTWAILNDVADAERAETCYAAMKEHLVSEVGALLLAPAFSKSAPQVGYITRYAPGLRENGGVYTHAATWAIAAASKMRDRDTVRHLLDAINPSLRDPERYWAEPYVTPGNVDGPESPYFGRGGWTWYTGSAAWLHRVVCEWVLGIRPEWDGLRIDPCLPTGWGKCRVQRPFRGSDYDITIEPSAKLSPGAAPEIYVNNARIAGQVIPPPEEKGKTYKVTVHCAG